MRDFAKKIDFINKLFNCESDDVKIDFDRFPPRTLAHGKCSHTNNAVHIYTDDDGMVNVAYFGEGEVIYSYTGERFTSDFKIEEHIPHIIHGQLSDLNFAFECNSHNYSVIKTENIPWKHFSKGDMELALIRADNGPISGPTLNPVFNKHLEVADEFNDIHGRSIFRSIEIKNSCLREVALDVSREITEAMSNLQNEEDQDWQPILGNTSKRSFGLNDQITKMIHQKVVSLSPQHKSEDLEVVTQEIQNATNEYINKLKSYYNINNSVKHHIG